eukprot:scpid4015/ scgid17527/ Neurogenic locus notch protein homolog
MCACARTSLKRTCCRMPMEESLTAAVAGPRGSLVGTHVKIHLSGIVLFLLCCCCGARLAAGVEASDQPQAGGVLHFESDDALHGAGDERLAGDGHGVRKRRQIPTASPSPPRHQYTIVPYYDSSIDRLSRSEARLFKNVLVPAAANYLSRVIRLNATSPVTISRACNGTSSYVNKQVNCDGDCAADTKCGPVVVPQGHLRGCYSCKACTGTAPLSTCCQQLTADGPGVVTHLLLYVSAINTTACANGTALMESRHCEQELTLDRPTAGYINFCPQNTFSFVNGDFKASANRVLRHLIRVMGFNSELFGYFRSVDGTPFTHRNSEGLPYFSGTYVVSDLTLRENYPQWPVANGTTLRHAVQRLVTPTVKSEVQNHFDCTRLDGAELELQADKQNQWEERVFHMDIMSSAVDFHTAKVSRITLALLQDTGWYNVDLSMGEVLHWGHKQGCGFVLQNCLGWINTANALGRPSNPYCTDLHGLAPLTCSNSHHALARCNLQIYPQTVPKDYQYFTTYMGVRTPFHMGGRNYLADYCPMIQEFNSSGEVSLCSNPDAATVFKESVQVFGPGSHCAQHENVWAKTDLATGTKTMLSDFTAGCYRFRCQQKQVVVEVGGKNFTCAYDSEWLSVSVDVAGFRYAGTLVCPRAADICTGYGCPNDCSYNGVCNTGNKTCQCRPGFFGTDCSSSFLEMWQDCASAPCRNGGSCTETAVSFTCSCPPGYTGGDCGVDINECQSQPCRNGATCVDLIGAVRCACPYGFTGAMCQTDISFCKSSPCQNNGVCSESVRSGVKTIICSCPASHRGDFCEEKIPDQCRFTRCVNGGTCVLTGGVATCNCAPGYTGVFCHLPVDYCMVEPCLNAAACHNGRVYRNCTCTAEYYGDACQHKIVRCSPGLCQAGGTCQDSATGGVCTCPPSTTGRYCEQQLYCYSGPCQHGSTCSETPGISFNCTCSAGYTGALCESDIDECLSTPCMHGGQCTDAVNAYSCQCLAGFTGFRCEVDMDECAPRPCVNGQCLDRVNSFLCNCSAGYTGALCQTDIDECQAKPCANDATCTDRVNAYDCQCKSGYTGKNCDADVLECDSNPCDATGAFGCVEGIAMYTCACRAGFTDPVCSTNIDECGSSPCGSGSCTDLVDGYSCSCSPGSTGARCQTDINECTSMPCLSGGTCINAIGRFKCLCPVHWTGVTCETYVDPCSVLSCSNGGTCYVDGSSGGTAKCLCSVAFTGTQCQASVTTAPVSTTTATPTTVPATTPSSVSPTHCSQTSCKNGGTCQSLSGVCSCLSGYVGDSCEIVVTDCSSMTCSNGGICTSHDAGITAVCECASGFFGDLCEGTPCTPNPCGTAACHAISETQHECICPAGKFGPACTDSVRMNHCLSAPCKNGATCTSFGSQFACKCAPGFTGHHCETNINECLSSPCRNNGICRDGANGFTCLCPNGLTGVQCEILLDACLSTPCQNGGKCMGGAGRYACECPPKYTGDHCQIPASHSCELLNCKNGATCERHSNGTVACVCQNGFGGSQCASSVHACSSSPCYFGGECIGSVQAPDWFACNCSGGYRGDRCEIAEVCYPNPCQNGGHCGPDDTSEYKFTCRCPFGYAGPFCEVLNDPCSSNPCALGSICSRTITGKYHCACAFPSAGPNCRSSTDAAGYSGAGLSMVRLDVPVKQSSFGIRLDVRPSTGEGLVLAMFWSSDGGQSGDFLALGLVGGRILIRYQLGGTAGSALATKILAVEKWLVVGVMMHGQMLQIMSHDASDTHRTPMPLDVKTSLLYVGGVSDDLLQRTQFMSNFRGCIQNSIVLAIGHTASLADLSKVTHFAVQACEESPCERLNFSCANGGSCHAHGTEFVCSCPLGFGRRDCKEALQFWRPQFQGVSFLSMKPVAASSGLYSRFEVIFRPQHSDGLVILGMQKNDGVGDFLSISLSAGIVQFRFDCGGVPVVIRSASPVSLHQWHNITVWRDGAKGWLVVDDGTAVFGQSTGPMKQLDLLYGLYIGGHPSEVLPPVAATPSGLTVPFRGCVAFLAVNNEVQNLASSSKSMEASSGVAECGDSTFCSGTCQSNRRGVCRDDATGTPACVCPLSTGGPTCSDAVAFKSASFAGVGHLTLDAAMYNISDLATDIDLQLRPTHGDGVLLALTQGEPGVDGVDYIWLSMANRTLSLRVNLGSGPVSVSSGPINLNSWTRVQIVRNQRNVILVVGGSSHRATTPGTAVGLTDATQLYLGGVPAATINPYGLGMAFGLRGCIAGVRVGGVPVTSLEAAAVEADGVSECTSTPPV